MINQQADKRERSWKSSIRDGDVLILDPEDLPMSSSPFWCMFTFTFDLHSPMLASSFRIVFMWSQTRSWQRFCRPALWLFSS